MLGAIARRYCPARLDLLWVHAWPPPRDPLRSEPRAASRVGAPSTGTQRRRHIKYDYQFYESLNLFFWRVRRPSRVQLRMQKWYARPMVHNIARVPATTRPRRRFEESTPDYDFEVGDMWRNPAFRRKGLWRFNAFRVLRLSIRE